MSADLGKKTGLFVTAIGHYVPGNILDNNFFDTLNIGSDAQWIVDRVGIQERRSILRPEEIRALRFGETTREDLFEAGRIMTFGQMGAKSWDLAMERAGLSTADLHADAVIGGTSVPDSDIPSHACYAARDSKLSTGYAYDTNSACSTFAVQLQTMRGAFAIGSARTWVESAPRGKCLEVVDTMVESSPEGADTIRMLDGKPFEQDGQAVQKFAILKTVAAAQAIMERNQLRVTDVNWFVGHQANLRMLMSAAQRIGIDPERHLYNVDFHGNQGGAGAPVTISQNWHRYRHGDTIVMSVVGSGLTWGSVLFRVHEVQGK
ncbi:hypothetical protein EBZ80_08510 [bacterium]|nr:hypothetical protein [bacterium]